MTKKVVVYIAQQAIEDLGKSKCYVNATPSTNRSKATVVVSDERVFTESEVKAILVNITHECGCYEHRGEPVFATRVDDINHIAARHGVSLDPA